MSRVDRERARLAAIPIAISVQPTPANGSEHTDTKRAWRGDDCRRRCASSMEQGCLGGRQELLRCRILFDHVGDTALEEVPLGVGSIDRVVHPDDLPPYFPNGSDQAWGEERADVVDEQDFVLISHRLIRAHDPRADPPSTMIDQEPVKSVRPAACGGGQRKLRGGRHPAASSIPSAPVERTISREPSAIARASARACCGLTPTTT